MRAIDPRLQARAARTAPSRLVRVSMSCNDPDNGCFAGRVGAIEIETLYLVGPKYNLEASLETICVEGYRFTVDDKGLRFRLHRQWFPFVRSKNWYGNWCWDAFVMKRPQAKRLLGVLRDSQKWSCTEAPGRFYGWFNGPRVKAESGKKSVLPPVMLPAAPATSWPHLLPQTLF